MIKLAETEKVDNLAKARLLYYDEEVVAEAQADNSMVLVRYPTRMERPEFVWLIGGSCGYWIKLL